MKLRPEQEQAVAWISRKRRACIVAPAGSGKTVIAAGALDAVISAKVRERPVRVGWMANTIEQCEQARRALDWFPATANLDVKIRCAAANTDWSDRDVLVVDECFPAGTIVSGAKIEDIQVGDYVETFCHDTDTIQLRKVIRTSKREAKRLVRVSCGGGVIYCTPEHPFWTGKKYEKAKDLQSGSMVLRLTMYEHSKLQVVPQGSHASFKVSKGQGSGWNRGLLLDPMLEGVSQKGFLRNNGANESEICLGANEAEQSNAKERGAGENVYDAAGNGASAFREGREWPTTNRARNATGERLGVGDLVCCANENQKGQRIPDLLQDRRCSPASQNRNRSGWAESRFAFAASPRREEGRVFAWVRVDDVTVQEQTSDGTFGGVCSGGFVYNLEVECEHNYFANGILVHNCHHSTAPQWGESVATCLGAVWGFTATPETGNDERDTMFRDFWQNIHTISRASVIHTLSSASVTWLDASDLMAGQIVEQETDRMVRYRGRFWKGDEGQLWGQCAWLCAVEHGIVNNKERNKAAIKAALSHSEPTLVLVNQVEHAQWMADQLPGAVACFAKMGKKKRKAAMDDFKAGKVQRLVATSLADEGLDLPVAAVLVLVSAGRSEIKTVQRTGRVLRIHEGKQGAIIYDFKDTFHGLMRKHAQKRRDIYAELGYKQA